MSEQMEWVHPPTLVSNSAVSDDANRRVDVPSTICRSIRAQGSGTRQSGAQRLFGHAQAKWRHAVCVRVLSDTHVMCVGRHSA
jgi:hypothetical protein